MKSAEDILEGHLIVTPIVGRRKALLVMEEYANQFREDPGWIAVADSPPPDYTLVLYFNGRTKEQNIGFFVWSETPVDGVTHWMFPPINPVT